MVDAAAVEDISPLISEPSGPGDDVIWSKFPFLKQFADNYPNIEDSRRDGIYRYLIKILRLFQNLDKNVKDDKSLQNFLNDQEARKHVRDHASIALEEMSGRVILYDFEHEKLEVVPGKFVFPLPTIHHSNN